MMKYSGLPEPKASAKGKKGLNKYKNTRVMTPVKIIVLVLLSMLLLFLLVVYIRLIDPMNVFRPSAEEDPDLKGFWDEINGGENPISTDRDKFTFLIAGLDVDGTHTDALMIALLNTKENTLSVLNIPRDTLVSIKTKEFSFWGKITNVYHNGLSDAKRNGFKEEELSEKSIGYLKGIIQYTFGIPIDFHIFINLQGVKTLVDEIDGVWYDVPIRMKYTDPYQNLYIDLQPGYQLLDGDKAEQLIRFRKADKGYPEYSSVGELYGTTARLNTQQKFLTAILKKILDDLSIKTISSLYSVGSKYMITNLPATDMLWFVPKMTNIKIENVRFHAVPSVYLDEHGYNHDIVYKKEAMAIINKYYNMYTKEIPESSFNIDEGGRMYVPANPPNYDIYSIDGVTADKFGG